MSGYNGTTDLASGWLVLCFALGVALPLLIALTWAVVKIARALHPELRNPPKDGSLRNRPQPPAPHPAADPVRSGDTSAACPECGAALPADSPHGLCARCLLKCAILSPGPTPSGVNPAGAAFVAPDPAELAPHFPQLEILELLGQGGMGAVYKARQLKLERFVALKVLPAEWSSDPAFAERFAREARALARLSHPHIVAVHDFGEAGGRFYLLMEYVDGANLRQILQSGPLDPRTTLQFIPQICEALQYAHDEGVVHRDVKPENILVDQRGRVKIADFGLAKLVGPSRASFTLTGSYQVMGTFDYMAPEQRSRPQEVDHRADIYSLGVVFYEMLTGELPLGRFAPPSHAAGVDGRLDEIVHRALEREPEQRYQHVSELRSALESVLDGGPFTGGTASDVRSPAPTDAEYVQLQVQGPAAVLIISALAGLIFWAVMAITIICAEPARYGFAPPAVLGKQATYSYGPGPPPFLMIVLAIALAGVIITGAVKLRRFNGYGFVIAASILAMLPWSPHCLIGIPAGIWAFWTLKRPEVRAAFAANLRRKRPPAPGDAEYVQLQVKGPAAALVLTALAALIFWVSEVVMEVWPHVEVVPVPFRIIFHSTGAFEIISFSLLGILLEGAIVVGAVKLRRFNGYGFVIAAIILAMLPWSPHCLIGIPAGIWAFWTLKRPEVRAAFAANLRRKRAPRPTPPPRPTGPVQRKARSFWRSFCAVFFTRTGREDPAAPPPTTTSR